MKEMTRKSFSNFFSRALTTTKIQIYKTSHRIHQSLLAIQPIKCLKELSLIRKNLPRLPILLRWNFQNFFQKQGLNKYL